MGTLAEEKLGEHLAEVIQLASYRRKRRSALCKEQAPGPTHGLAHVYVDLLPGDQVQYGLRAVDRENAAVLLGPALYLIGQLIQLATGA